MTELSVDAYRERGRQLAHHYQIPIIRAGRSLYVLRELTDTIGRTEVAA